MIAGVKVEMVRVTVFDESERHYCEASGDTYEQALRKAEDQVRAHRDHAASCSQCAAAKAEIAKLTGSSK